MKKNYKDIRYLELQKNGWWSVSSLLPNILPIDITLRCWLRLYRRRKLRIINVILYSKKKEKKKKNFHYLKKGWVSPVKCHDYTTYVYWRCENSAHSSTVQCGKPMFTYLGEKKNLKCMKCSLHMYPTSPLHVPKREIIYLSVYWFENSKTSLKERKLGFRQE